MEAYDSEFWKIIDGSVPQDEQAAAEEWARRQEQAFNPISRIARHMGWRPVEGGYVAPDDDDGA